MCACPRPWRAHRPYIEYSRSARDISSTGPELASGHCFIGRKAEVYDAELHAIQEALLYIVTAGWAPASLLICVDNQAATDPVGGQPGRLRICTAYTICDR